MKTRVHLRCSHSLGFTLVELMVVIMVTIILACVVAAGFKTARLRANQSVSTTNLRQLATANLLYVSDNQSYAPATDRTNRIRWHGARTSAAGKFDPEQGYLSEYFGKSRTVSTCPEFKRFLTDKDSFENGSGGYGYNALYIGGLPENPFKPNRPANVPDPSNTLMFATTAFAVAGGLQEYPFADPPRSVEVDWELGGPLQPSVHFRFNGRALIAWCDGRVTEERANESAPTNFYGGSNKAVAIGFCGPTENNGWWNPRKSISP